MKVLYQLNSTEAEAEVSYDEETGKYLVFIGEGFENNDAKFFPALLIGTLEKMKQAVIRHQNYLESNNDE